MFLRLFLLQKRLKKLLFKFDKNYFLNIFKTLINGKIYIYYLLNNLSKIIFKKSSFLKYLSNARIKMNLILKNIKH